MILLIRAILYGFPFSYPLYPRNDKWSQKLEYLMDEGFEIEILDNFRGKIGPEYVWIENFPYGCFYRLDNATEIPPDHLRFMPKLTTWYKLCKMIEKAKKDIKISNLKNFENKL